MTIRDRVKKKWHFAFGMPELIKAQRDLWTDHERILKAIIDEHEKEEFDQHICNAMEYNLLVRITKWLRTVIIPLFALHQNHLRNLEF